MDKNSGSYGRGWRTPARGIFLRLDFFLSTHATRTCKRTARPRGFGEGEGSHRVTELGWSRPSGSSRCHWEPNLVCFPLWRTSPSSLYCLRLIGGPQTRRIINVESNYRLRWKKKKRKREKRLDDVGQKLSIKPRVKIKHNPGSRDWSTRSFVSSMFSPPPSACLRVLSHNKNCRFGATQQDFV